MVLDLLCNRAPVNHSTLQLVQRICDLKNCANDEIKYRFYLLCLRSGDADAVFGDCLAWLGTVGRMKYTRPIFRYVHWWDLFMSHVHRALKKYKSASIDGLSVARKRFESLQNFYHPIAISMISKDLQ